MSEVITDVVLHQATRERYLNYALSVITSRALPDVRDGLKPVQRRILYAMYQDLRLYADARHRKSAAIVGEVMGKYHPHGDQSIYDAMVRLAQSFSLRYPLVDGQGNFGSLDGDSAAAMRYTEARLRHLAEELLGELRKKTVDYRPNYDGSMLEPVVLPAQLPNLLINGAQGIAVGMATNIPPHHLGEVVKALIARIDDPEIPLERIVGPIVKGPDFPNGGEMLNSNADLLVIYETGSGPVEVRGQWELEGEGRRKRIVITSIPYQVNKANLILQIADHIRGGKIPMLVDVRDESTEDIRIVLDLRRGANPEAAMAFVYKRTQLQSRFNVNLTALVPGPNPEVCQPRRLGLLEVLDYFLEFRQQVTQRRLTYDREQLEKRIHLLAGFAIIFDVLDEAIALIRASNSKAEARERLMSRFGLDWEQAEAVLEIKLYRLAHMEIDAVRRELAEKEADAAALRLILGSEERMMALVRSELENIAEAYRDRRRTVLTGPVEALEFSEETYIVRENVFVMVSRGGRIKRQKSYSDLTAVRVRDGDEIGWCLPASTRDTVILFTDTGRAYTVRVADLPQTTGYGDAVQTRFDFGDGEHIVGVLTSDTRSWPRLLPEDLEDLDVKDPNPPYAVAVSRAGKTVRFSLTNYLEPSTRAGRFYQRLLKKFPPGDGVVACYISDGREVVSLGTRAGRVLLFEVGEINVLSGPGKGVMAIKLEKTDFVLGFELTSNKMEGLKVETNRGRVEVIRPNKYQVAKRGNRGRELIRVGHLAKVYLRTIEVGFDESDIDVEPEGDSGEEPAEVKDSDAGSANAALDHTAPIHRALDDPEQGSLFPGAVVPFASDPEGESE